MINPASPDFLNTPVHPGRPRYNYTPVDYAILPAVTIITPFYNVAPDLFQETAQSVLQQSFQQWEWLIVNDGSTDPASLAVIDTYRTKDIRIRIIDHPNNKGLGAARNTGFAEAKTDFVALLDGDDLLEPTAIEKWFWFLISHPQFSFTKGYAVGFGAQQYLWSKGFERNQIFLTENQVDTTALICRKAWQDVGGYEADCGGVEDWEFWIRCASKGYWGATIPEYLNWYRRRKSHGDRWITLRSQTNIDNFRKELQRKYPSLYAGQFPQIQRESSVPYSTISTKLPCQNLLQKSLTNKRILFIYPWLSMGGADKFNLDLVEQLTRRGYEITICTTLPSENHWYAEFARFTPDIFHLPNFLKPKDYPRFLVYLINSRQIDTLLISNSYLGYQLLPFLRSRFPDLPIVDYIHMEEEYWKNGGYPRAGVGYQELLDLNIVSTCHLKQWMMERGGAPTRIEVCHTNISPERWQPTDFDRTQIRVELGVDDATPLILYAGRLVEQKRPRIFAEIVRQLAQNKDLTFVCVVAGDGPDLSYLEQFAQQHALESHLRFVGTVSLARMKALQAAADIFLLPSKMEGLSLALFEALAMETVPVGADVGGQAELVTPECGYLIPHSENELDEYVRVLKALIESPDLRQKLAKAGRERVVNHFRLEQMADRMESLLAKAHHLAQTAPRPPVSKGLGLECATQAVEYTRLEKVADELWQMKLWLEQQNAAPAGSEVDSQVIINQLSGEDIAHQIPIKKLIKAIGFKLGKQPGLHWLHNFRQLGKQLVGE